MTFKQHMTVNVIGTVSILCMAASMGFTPVGAAIIAVVSSIMKDIILTKTKK